MRQIVDHARQEEEVKFKLEEANREEPRHMTQFNIRDDSKLKVHIVDAQNLRDDSQTIVMVKQDNSMSETNVRMGNGPIWNEAIVFDIKDPYQPVVLQMISVDSQKTILESTIDLNLHEVRDYRQQGNDIWCYAMFDEDENGVESGPKMRIRVHYNYSDVQRYESLLDEWNNCILVDCEEKRTIDRYLENLSDPFNFFSMMVSEQAAAVLNQYDREDLAQEQ